MPSCLDQKYVEKRRNMEFYSRSENENGEKEYLYQHMEKTVALAESFAEQFGEAEAGRLLGLTHDAGKASEL